MQSDTAPSTRNITSTHLASALMGLMLSVFSLSADCNPLLSWLTGGEGRVTNVTREVASLHDHNAIWGLAFSPDGQLLATTSPGNVDLNLWDWRAGRIVRTLQRPSSDTTTTEPISFSPDGRFLASCQASAGTDGVAIRIWDTTTWQVVKDVRDPVSGGYLALAFTPDSQTLILVTGGFRKDLGGNNLVVYSTRTWQPIWGTFVDIKADTLAVSPDGRFVATAGDYYTPLPVDTLQPRIAIIDLTTHHLVCTIDANAPSHYGNMPQQLVWSPDGTHIAIGFWNVNPGDDAVRIFDARTGALVAGDKPDNPDHILGVRYTPDGKYFIDANIDNHIHIWDGAHRQLLDSLRAWISSLAVTRDGKYFAAGGKDRVVVWELK